MTISSPPCASTRPCTREARRKAIPDFIPTLGIQFLQEKMNPRYGCCVPNDNTLEAVFTKAREVAAAHPDSTLLFHGQPPADILAAYLVKELHRMQGDKFPKHYQYFRPPHDPSVFRYDHEKTHPDTRAALVSVSTSLDCTDPGESAWHFFLLGRRERNIYRDIFDRILKGFSLTPEPTKRDEIKRKFLDLTQELCDMCLPGNMHIIAIPAAKVSKALHTCYAYNACTQLVDPSDPISDQQQGRILPDALPPDSGARMYIVSSLTKEERTYYKGKMRDIAQRLLGLPMNDAMAPCEASEPPLSMSPPTTPPPPPRPPRAAIPDSTPWEAIKKVHQKKDTAQRSPLDEGSVTSIFTKAREIHTAHPSNTLLFHGQPAADILFAYLIKELHRANGGNPPKHYQYLRPPAPPNANELRTKQLSPGEMSPMLVSVSPSLDYFDGDCVWLPLLKKPNNRAQQCQEIFDQIVRGFSLDPKQKKRQRLQTEFTALVEEIDALSRSGNVHIIAVPSDKMDAAFHLSNSLNSLRTRCNPNAPISDEEQGRILPDALPPDSGARMYIASSLTKEERTYYKGKMRDIAQRLLGWGPVKTWLRKHF